MEDIHRGRHRFGEVSGHENRGYPRVASRGIFHAVNRADNGRPKKAKREELCRDLMVIKTKEDAECRQAKNTCVVVDLLAASCERLSAEQPTARFQIGERSALTKVRQLLGKPVH